MFRTRISDNVDIDSIKSAIIEDLSSIKDEVDGMDSILDLLNTSDYFTAPASTRYHLACPHGLMIHSYNVAQNMIELDKLYGTKLSKRTMYICGYLHDINKINSYIKTKKNINIMYKWIEIDSYSFKKDGVQGHGDLSVIMLIVHGLRLTDEEIGAIQMHMGAFHYGHSWETTQQLTSTYKQYDSALLLHLADMISTYRSDIGCEYSLTDKELYRS